MDDEFKFNTGYDSVKLLGNEWLKSQLFDPKKVVMSYGKDKLAIGIDRQGKLFFIDTKEACRIFLVGTNRCLDEDTLIEKNKKIKDLCVGDDIKSYNFEEHCSEYKKILNKWESEEECYKIIFDNNDYVIASGNHRFYKVENIFQIQYKLIYLSELKIFDKLLYTDYGCITWRVIKSIKKIGKRKTIDIEVEDNHNFFLNNGILSHNSGKTWLMRSMIDRLRAAGHACVFLVDCKNEILSGVEPLQKKFHKLLYAGETPCGIETITLRPTFFKSLQPPYNTLPKDNVWFSVRLNDMTKNDFMTLMQVHELTPNQRISMEEIWNEISKMENFNSIDQINAIIERMQDLNDTQISSLKRKFKTLIFNQFFEEKYCIDILPAIKNGVVIAINLENFESFGRENASMPQVFLAIILRKIIQARRRKLLPGIFIFIDEASRFVPKDYEGTMKRELNESVSLDARYYINYVMAAQEWDAFPEQIINQCRYVMIPYSAPIPTFAAALKSTGLVKNVQSLNSTTFYIKKSLQKHDWLVLDRVLQTKIIIKPLAPRSAHMETSKD